MLLCCNNKKDKSLCKTESDSDSEVVKQRVKSAPEYIPTICFRINHQSVGNNDKNQRNHSLLKYQSEEFRFLYCHLHQATQVPLPVPDIHHQLPDVFGSFVLLGTCMPKGFAVPPPLPPPTFYRYTFHNFQRTMKRVRTLSAATRRRRFLPVIHQFFVPLPLFPGYYHGLCQRHPIRLLILW